MRNRVAERFAPTELIELRAAAEAKPARTPKPFVPAYPGVSADVLPWLRAADTSWAALGMRRPVAPTAPKPIVLADWSKALAWTWAYAESAIAVRVKDAKAMLGADRNAPAALFAPLFADLADFAAELDDDRGAMLANVNAERVLIADAVKAGA